VLIVLVTSRCKDVSEFDVIWATDCSGSGRVGSGMLPGQKSRPGSISDVGHIIRCDMRDDSDIKRDIRNNT